MKTCPISVIIPNYNHAGLISHQLEAVLGQSVRPCEIIVIDDASTDDSVSVIERFTRRDPLVRLVRNEKNLGAIRTINKGIGLASGDYFYGASADDAVAPGAFEKVAGMIERHPEAGLIIGKVQLIDPDGATLDELRCARWTEARYATPREFLDDYLDAEYCTHSLSASTFYRRDALVEAGGLRPELGHWGDTFIIRAIGLKYGVAYLPEVLTRFLSSPECYSQVSGRNIKLMLDVVARAARLMRAPEFRDRFPEAHVASWEKSYRDHLCWNYLETVRRSAGAAAGAHAGPLSKLARRARARLRVERARWELRSYSPDFSGLA